MVDGMTSEGSKSMAEETIAEATVETESASKEWRPTLLAYLCNWCSYAGANLAGASRLEYDAAIRIIRVPCSGRVDPLMVYKAFERGADGVLVSGCHIGDCHYIDANHWTEKRVQNVHKRMAKLDIRPERLQLEWISAAEGVRFAELMKNMETLRQGVTSDEIAQTIEILKDEKKLTS